MREKCLQRIQWEKQRQQTWSPVVGSDSVFFPHSDPFPSAADQWLYCNYPREEHV